MLISRQFHRVSLTCSLTSSQEAEFAWEDGDARPTGNANLLSYTWIPFGGGVRRCLGASFAEFELAVVLRELVARRRLRPVGEPERSIRSTITNVPNRGAEVLATPR